MALEWGDDESHGPLLTRKTLDTVTVVPLYEESDKYFLDPQLQCAVPMRAKVKPDMAKTIFGRTVKISRIGLAANPAP